MRVSVAMAAYNGSRFLKEQLESVLPQLGKEDELVVSADPSSDGTGELLRLAAEKDARIRVLQGPGRGVCANFENALRACKRELVFLCDQDDVWLPGKVKKVGAALGEEGVLLVLHDAKVTDGELRVTCGSFFRQRGTAAGILRNLLRNSYVGCCMAFRRELLPHILPFPPDLPMHDQWIGLMAEKYGKVRLLREPLLLYRRHGENASPETHAPPAQMLRWRFAILRAVVKG